MQKLIQVKDHITSNKMNMEAIIFDDMKRLGNLIIVHAKSNKPFPLTVREYLNTTDRWSK